MKKYIITIIVCVIVIMGIFLSCKRESVPYNFHYHHGKLLKETIVWLYDSDCYRQSGTYKRVYRKYDYHYTDSIENGMHINNDNTLFEYAVTYRGDTVFMEYTDLTNYPRREE